MEDQGLRSQADLCLFPALQLAISMTSLILIILTCKIGIRIIDHFLCAWLTVNTQLLQVLMLLMLLSGKGWGVIL